MSSTTVFFVQNKRTLQVLNLKGGWSDGLGSYRLAQFATLEDATAVIPEGVDCKVVSRKVKEQ